MLSTSDIAEKLGVTRQTVFNWIKSGKLFGLKIGGTWRVYQEDFDAFINKNPSPSTDDDPPKP